MADTTQQTPGTDSQHSVRFASVTQEISAPKVETESTDDTMDIVRSITSPDAPDEHWTEDQKKELKELSVSLQQSRIQSARMDQFMFDPLSLPPSRVPSGGSTHKTGSFELGPRDTPLTPADSGSGSKDSPAPRSPVIPALKSGHFPTIVTPQESPRSPTANKSKLSTAQQSDAVLLDSKHRDSKDSDHSAIPTVPSSSFTEEIPRADSPLPQSRNDSFSGTPAPGSGAQTPNSELPRAKQPPPPLTAADKAALEVARYPFKRGYDSGPPSPRPQQVQVLRKGSDDGRKDKDHHHSMSDLRRFLRKPFGSSKKRDKSPAPDKDRAKRERSDNRGNITGTPRSSTPQPISHRNSSIAIPFSDHPLEEKYGKFERILGSGAGGSVRLMKRGDGVTFAVKQFRERHNWETEKAYNKKITAEFCIGSTLHHGNIIEAMDILQEGNRWYEVMEYAPYDLFNIVMTGQMSREEVACCTMQILNGVAYIHGMGLAHRDLKLDNVVVNEHGIMKIIDFGSAHVFHYPFEDELVLAEGVVGSDPYLAPEVFLQKQYDAEKVDIWSLAIIFCCMTLRRFPWKCPKNTDNSFKLFITQPTDEELAGPLYPGTTRTVQSEPASRHPSGPASSQSQSAHSEPAPATSAGASAKAADAQSVNSTATTVTPTALSTAQIIKGPWRLLRLLPRETRHILGSMLETDPVKRASLDQVLADPWIAKAVCCRQEAGGLVLNEEGHVHTLAAADEGS